jgi:peroxiredoxin
MEPHMSLKFTGVLAGIVVLVAVAACAEPPVAAQGPRTPQQLLADVVKAYQDAPALTDEIRVEMRVGANAQTTERRFAAGPGADARLVLDGFVFTAVDGTLSAYRQDLPEKYFQTPLQGNLAQTYLQLTGGMPLPVPQLAMRTAETPEDYLPSLGMMVAANMAPASGETPEGTDPDLEVIPLAGDNGATGAIFVDPRTNFMKRMEVRAGGVTLVSTMNPKRLEALPEPIAFDASGRRRVDSMQAVAQLGAGDPAPDFTLPTLDGDPVSLQDYHGSLVVLDFWATWCGPCRMALPRLQQFQNWARTEGLPVQVLPVNVGERTRGKENIRRNVAAFWKSGGFTMPTLVDYESSVAVSYGVGPIPHTVVVGPDGIIRHVETGFHPNFAEQLKALARRHATERTGS